MRRVEPYVRTLRGYPVVILTEPAPYGLFVMPDGCVARRSLMGVEAGEFPGHAGGYYHLLTEPQRETLDALLEVWP